MAGQLANQIIINKIIISFIYVSNKIAVSH